MSGASLHFQAVCGVEMIVAIDSTVRGPALGGCRWRPYPDLSAAREEARALARAMTLKAALARLTLGGGKAVVRADPRSRTREQLLAFGELVDSLDGRYITAADMGTGQDEMAVIRERTRHVAGLPKERGGCGEPAPFTAQGVFMAMEAALAHRGRVLKGAVVAVQGVGNVGLALVRHLVDGGAIPIVADADPARCDGLPEGVRVVDPQEILAQSCDVLAPCGPAGVIDARAVSELDCEVVCGAANNQLSGPQVAALLQQRGVLYVPDFLANAGGLIHLATALGGADDAASRRNLRVIPENLDRVLSRARSDGCDMALAAERLALESVTAGCEPDDLG